jgi:hypothetical protein
MARKPEIVKAAARLFRFARLRYRTRSGFGEISDQPAFDPEFEAHFRERIKSVKLYLEFGSGASTILAARAGVRTICVESDRRFADAVRMSLAKDALTKVIDVDIGFTEEWGYPVFINPTARRLTRWCEYTERALAEIDCTKQFPDMVLVDGRFRVACALAVADRAKQLNQATIIYVDDYVGRPHYKIMEDYLGPPVIIGRTACFALQPETIANSLSAAVIKNAHCDFR